MSELVINGGFEVSTTTLTGWTPEGNIGLFTPCPHEGRQAAIMSAKTGVPASLAQTDILVMPSANYQIGFSLAGTIIPDWGNQFQMTGTWSTGTTFAVQVPVLNLDPCQDYAYYYTVQTAPSGATTLSLNFSLSTQFYPVGVLLDDVSMVQVL